MISQYGLFLRKVYIQLQIHGMLLDQSKLKFIGGVWCGFLLLYRDMHFFLWLAIKNSLSTRDWLLQWVYKGDIVCTFCRGCIEDRDHLFFHCSFSKRVWREVLRRCMVGDPPLIWEEVMKWGITDLKGRSLNVSLCKLAFGAVVYHLWK